MWKTGEFIKPSCAVEDRFSHGKWGTKTDEYTVSIQQMSSQNWEKLLMQSYSMNVSERPRSIATALIDSEGLMPISHAHASCVHVDSKDGVWCRAGLSKACINLLCCETHQLNFAGFVTASCSWLPEGPELHQLHPVQPLMAVNPVVVPAWLDCSLYTHFCVTHRSSCCLCLCVSHVVWVTTVQYITDCRICYVA